MVFIGLLVIVIGFGWMYGLALRGSGIQVVETARQG
jgi:hypothetical protein